MSEIVQDSQTAGLSASPAALLFGDDRSPPVWLWLALEPEEVTALEAALLDHLRSPLFPTRIGAQITAGDDTALLYFAQRFGPIAGRFSHGSDLVLAACRVVAERRGTRARDGAIACIEALQLRLHGEARSLAEAPAGGEKLRRFVLGARLAADLWVRFIGAAEDGQGLLARLLLQASAAQPGTGEQPPIIITPVAPAPAQPGVTLLQPFEAPNERQEWQTYRALTAPLPFRQVPRDALARLGALAEQAPSFAGPLREIRRALALAAHAGRPSPRLRPILLVGAPGIGKTWFARRVAEALDLPFASLNLGGATDNRSLQGTARGWSAATPAWPVSELSRHAVPNPLLFLDEVDKAGGQRETNGRVHDTLLAMIEPESAGAWFDECLRSNADLRHIVWIMAANETRGIPAPLLSRLSVHQIEPPPASAFAHTLSGLLRGIARDLGCEAAELPVLDGVTQLALQRSFSGHRNLRRLRAQIEECLGLAAEQALSVAH